MATTLDILVRARDQASATINKVQAAGSRLGTAFNGVTQKLSAVGARMSSIGTRMTTFVTLPILAAGKAAFDLASDLNESMSKVDVVFGKSAKAIQDWSKTSATAMGISRQEALEAAGTFGNLFRSMQIGMGPTSDMSKNLVQLAADLASFNNADPTEVLVNLRAGLLGEAEPLRKFGIQMSAARIATEAVNLGIAKQGEELTAAQKAQAAYAIIMADSALAQGDFARTADGAANQQRILNAQFKDAAATLGQQLLPIGQKIIGFVTGLLQGLNNLSPQTREIVIQMLALAAAAGPLLLIFGKLAQGIAFIASPVGLVVLAIVALAAAFVIAYQKSEAFREVVQGVVEWFRSEFLPAFMEVVDWLVGTFGPVFTELGKTIKVALNLIAAFWKDWGDRIVAIIRVIVDFWKNNIKAGLEFIAGIIKTILAVIRGDWGAAWDGIKQAVGAVWDAIKNIVKTAINAVKEVVLTVARALREALGGIWNGIKTAVSNAWNALKQVAITVWNGIASAIRAAVNTAIRAINVLINDMNKVSSAGDFLAGPFLNWGNIPPIPELAKGGIVMGPTLALIGEAGPEAVVPLGRGGFGGGSLTVNVTVEGSVITENELTETVQANLLRKLKRNGTLGFGT